MWHRLQFYIYNNSPLSEFLYNAIQIGELKKNCENLKLIIKVYISSIKCEKELNSIYRIQVL
jgi:hypothetical protein